MSIELLNESGDAVDETDLLDLARFVLAQLRIHPLADLSIILVDEEAMERLHIQWMDEPGPTDVLSFPMDDEPVAGVPTLLGDVVISPAVAAGQFAEHAGTLDDELALLVVHGILHVLGHDHAEPDETALMRARELDLLARFHWRGTAPSGFRQSHD